MSGCDRRDQFRPGAPTTGWQGASGTATGEGACITEPSAQELMMYADGELDPSRAARVALFLRDHPEAQAKLSRMAYASQLLAGGMLARAQAAGADQIVDAVMARIDSGALVTSLGQHRARQARSGRAVRVVAAISVTLAVAAACTLWARSLLRHRVAARLALESATTLGATAPSQGMSAIGAPIKIDAVDFGARAGTIFYVKTEGDKTETPVLWVTDDDAGPGNEEGKR